MLKYAKVDGGAEKRHVHKKYDQNKEGKNDVRDQATKIGKVKEEGKKQGEFGGQEREAKLIKY